ncbi:MAG TPA: hypothetical protein DCE39_01665 [Planctomycetaceae bacterium]|nr:hypothetical protein [Planctomycetaceae bacterium]
MASPSGGRGVCHATTAFLEPAEFHCCFQRVKSTMSWSEPNHQKIE